MMLDPVALEAHRFAYDPASIDKQLVDFLQRFYTLSDDRENAAEWAACFSEDGVMKRASADVTGRKAIAEVNQGSWIGQSSRQHIVSKVFPFQYGTPDEVMLHGISKYVYDDQTTGEMIWAARLAFKRHDDGNISIDLYHIYPGGPPKKT